MPTTDDLIDASATSLAALTRTIQAAQDAADDATEPMPAAILAGHAPDHTPEWHDLRSRGIGGSEVAAILGLSPWQSQFSLWHSKRAGWATEPNDEMRWGTALEPALIRWWYDTHPGSRPYGVRGGSYRHRSASWRLANPDDVARLPDGVLAGPEIKGSWPSSRRRKPAATMPGASPTPTRCRPTTGRRSSGTWTSSASTWRRSS